MVSTIELSSGEHGTTHFDALYQWFNSFAAGRHLQQKQKWTPSWRCVVACLLLLLFPLSFSAISGSFEAKLNRPP